MPDSPASDNEWLSGPQPNPTSNPNPVPSVNPTGEIPYYSPPAPSSAQLGSDSSAQSSPITDFHGPAQANQPSTLNPYSANQPPTNSSPYPLPHTPKPGRPFKKLAIFSIVILFLLVSAGGAFAYKMFRLDALTAPRDLILSSVADKSGKFSLTAAINAATTEPSVIADLSKVTVSSTGSYDSTDPKNPKVDVNINGNLGVSKFAGELLETDGTLFLKITRFDVLSAFGIKFGSSWYKTPASLTSSFSSSEKNCDYSVLKNPSGNVLDEVTGTDIPIKNASRIGIFETVDGHQTTHYHGELDNTKLASYVADANKKLSGDCQIDLSPADYKDLTVGYDIWTSPDFDRFKANFYNSSQKATVDLTLDLSDFNKPVTITAPAGAKDINQLIPLDEFSLPSSGPSNITTQSRDSTRRTDIYDYATYLARYYQDNQGYPPTSQIASSASQSGIFSHTSALLKGGYMSAVRLDPSNGQSLCRPNSSSPTAKCSYKYLSDSSGNTFVVWALLENPSSQGGVFFVNSNGERGYSNLEPTAPPSV